MLHLMTSSGAPDLARSVRGVFFQGAFPDRCVIVAYDHHGTLRRKVEVGQRDLGDEEVQMKRWLDLHDPL